MIHKFKPFFRKIKNWLSSLSKWAKKHCKKLILLSLAFLLLGISVFTNKCSKNQRAEASSLSSSSAFILTPNVDTAFRYSSFYSGSIMPFFINYSNTQDKIVLYVPRATSPTTGLVYRAVSIPFGGSFYSGTINDINFVLNVFESGSPRYRDMTGIISYSFDVELPTLEQCYNYILSACSYCSINISDSNTIIYDYCLNDGTVVFSLGVDGFSFDSTVTTGSFNRYSAFNIVVGTDIDDATQVLINNSYNDGFNDGYLVGLEENLDNVSPLTPFVIGISDFMTTKIFGVCSISDLLAIGMGCILFWFTIKMFLGG